MVNSKQTVTAATTGANSGQTPSPWWNTLMRLPEEVLYQSLQHVTKCTLSELLADASAYLRWLKQKQNPLQFSH